VLKPRGHKEPGGEKDVEYFADSVVCSRSHSYGAADNAVAQNSHKKGIQERNARLSSSHLDGVTTHGACGKVELS